MTTKKATAKKSETKKPAKTKEERQAAKRELERRKTIADLERDLNGLHSILALGMTKLKMIAARIEIILED